MTQLQTGKDNDTLAWMAIQWISHISKSMGNTGQPESPQTCRTWAPELNYPFQGRPLYKKHFGTSVSSIEGNRILSFGPHPFLVPLPFPCSSLLWLGAHRHLTPCTSPREYRYQYWLQVRLTGRGNETKRLWETVCVLPPHADSVSANQSPQLNTLRMPTS